MKIFSASQIKAWDEYTIQHEPIASIDLMERASIGCVTWLKKNFKRSQKIILFCGPGNNGGDGLAIARLMLAQGFAVDIYVLQSDFFSNDFTVNLQRLRSISQPVHYLIRESDIPPIGKDVIVIDALFGYGLNRPLQGLAGILVTHINASGAVILSIDMPSGLLPANVREQYCCKGNRHPFPGYEACFPAAGKRDFTGNVEIIDIGLHESFYRGRRV